MLELEQMRSNASLSDEARIAAELEVQRISQQSAAERIALQQQVAADAAVAIATRIAAEE